MDSLHMQFPVEHRIILTGTPVQNDLKELYSLLSFVAPNIFRPKFSEAFYATYSGISSNGSTQCEYSWEFSEQSNSNWSFESESWFLLLLWQLLMPLSYMASSGHSSSDEWRKMWFMISLRNLRWFSIMDCLPCKRSTTKLYSLRILVCFFPITLTPHLVNVFCLIWMPNYA